MSLIFLKKEILWKAYADDTTFFLKGKKSVIELMKTLDVFRTFFELKRKKNKCKIAGLGPMKGVILALFGIECIDLVVAHKTGIYLNI